MVNKEVCCYFGNYDKEVAISVLRSVDKTRSGIISLKRFYGTVGLRLKVNKVHAKELLKVLESDGRVDFVRCHGIRLVEVSE